MNYYNRITEVISGDQIIAESQEQQERIDELLGRIGRAMGTLLSSKPANPYTGQWNPLRGKYEGGLNADDRRAAIRARVAAKKKDAAPAGFKTPDQTKLGMPKSMGNIGKLPSAAPTGFKTPDQTKIGMPKSMGNIGKLPAAAPAKPNPLAPPKPIKNIIPPTGDEFGAGVKDAPKFKPAQAKLRPTTFNPNAPVTPGAQPKATGPRRSRKARIGPYDPRVPNPLDQGPTNKSESITYYGYITKLIRESFQLNEKKGPCWKGYEAIGMKMKGGRKVPNCVPKSK